MNDWTTVVPDSGIGVEAVAAMATGYPGNHLMQFGRGSYLREIGRFLRDSGFSPG